VEDSLEDEQLLCEALLEIEENRLWCNWRRSSILLVDRLSDALECLQRDSFDAVLLNLSLPDSSTLLDSFLEISAGAAAVPILVLADEADENLANRLLRAGAQDVLLKSEIECAPLAHAIRYAIERQRRLSAARASAFVDELTGVLPRHAHSSSDSKRNGHNGLHSDLDVEQRARQFDDLPIRRTRRHRHNHAGRNSGRKRQLDFSRLFSIATGTSGHCEQRI
jgi:DNA-binding NarL/FixJ family response regulator